tara:strand:- start:877 stop:1263 length:387 start_codon:yes stop_codon:yes gene_type:complete
MTINANTRRTILDHAYSCALEAANASGATPGLDEWWTILKAEEAAVVESETAAVLADEHEEPADGPEWAAYNLGDYNRNRWSKAHVVLADGSLLCGRDPGHQPEWANIDDARTSKCKVCALRAPLMFA